MDYYEEMFKNVDKNIKLDEEQIKAIEEEGNEIILAGAGSGKTTTLTAKIKYLVEKNNINPNQILMLSFTNEATAELIKRINIDFKIPVKILTFHKLGLKIINQIKHYNVIADSNQIVKKIIKNKYNIFRNIDESSILKITKEILEYKEQIKKTVNKKIYQKYQSFLEQNNSIDFADMIIKATEFINQEQVKLNYKYIIVDEYQDISCIRYNLLKSITKSTGAKIIVVGDDYQSIFAFAGSNINLFLNFQKEFNAKMYFLNQTYRNSQELIKIASDFIKTNEKQISKKLKSSKHLDNPIEIKWYKNNREKVVREILKQNVGKTLMLGRYNFDVKGLEKYLNENVLFMTIHASKGLGFDNVILLNINKGKYGFPSPRTSIEEERRLMYVALTRTKNRVYIIAKKRHSSKFLKEIKKII